MRETFDSPGAWIFKTGCVMMGMVASNSDHNVQSSADSDFLILDYLLVSWFVTLDPRPEIIYSSILKLLESCLLGIRTVIERVTEFLFPWVNALGIIGVQSGSVPFWILDSYF